LASTAPRIPETSACGRFRFRSSTPKGVTAENAEFVAPQEHLIELLRAHFVGSTWIGESLFARVTPVAIENEADMFGHKSGADLFDEVDAHRADTGGATMRGASAVRVYDRTSPVRVADVG